MQQQRLALEAAGEPRTRQRAHSSATGIPLARTDVLAREQNPGKRVLRTALSHRLAHLCQHAGAVQGLQPQRQEMIRARRTAGGGCRRQHHAPPELMQRRRARRQIEGGEVLFQLARVQPGPKIQWQARGVGRHHRRQIAALDGTRTRLGDLLALQVGLIHGRGLLAPRRRLLRLLERVPRIVGGRLGKPRRGSGAEQDHGQGRPQGHGPGSNSQFWPHGSSRVSAALSRHAPAWTSPAVRAPAAAERHIVHQTPQRPESRRR